MAQVKINILVCNPLLLVVQAKTHPRSVLMNVFAQKLWFDRMASSVSPLVFFMKGNILDLQSFHTASIYIIIKKSSPSCTP